MNTQTDIHLDQDAISALMDGQLQGAELSAALQGMASQDARDCWRMYHLVGDVLRSSELARGRHDSAFADGVLRRLGAPADNAVLLAPPAAAPLAHAARPAANDGVFRWKMVAGLASFAAVAAVGWGLLGGAGPQAPGPQWAQAPAQAARGGAPVQTLVAATAAPSANAAPAMLRDPQLDELLAAHRAAAGASALGNAAGFLRNATFDGPGR